MGSAGSYLGNQPFDGVQPHSISNSSEYTLQTLRGNTVNLKVNRIAGLVIMLFASFQSSLYPLPVRVQQSCLALQLRGTYRPASPADHHCSS